MDCAARNTILWIVCASQEACATYCCTCFLIISIRSNFGHSKGMPFASPIHRGVTSLIGQRAGRAVMSPCT